MILQYPIQTSIIYNLFSVLKHSDKLQTHAMLNGFIPCGIKNNLVRPTNFNRRIPIACEKQGGDGCNDTAAADDGERTRPLHLFEH